MLCLCWHKYAKYFSILNGAKIELTHSTAPINLHAVHQYHVACPNVCPIVLILFLSQHHKHFCAHDNTLLKTSKKYEKRSITWQILIPWLEHRHEKDGNLCGTSSRSIQATRTRKRSAVASVTVIIPVDVPGVDVAVKRRRENDLLARHKLDVLHHVRVTSQHTDLLIHVTQVPQADRLVVRTRRKHPSVQEPSRQTRCWSARTKYEQNESHLRCDGVCMCFRICCWVCLHFLFSLLVCDMFVQTEFWYAWISLEWVSRFLTAHSTIRLQSAINVGRSGNIQNRK